MKRGDPSRADARAEVRNAARRRGARSKKMTGGRKAAPSQRRRSASATPSATRSWPGFETVADARKEDATRARLVEKWLRERGRSAPAWFKAEVLHLLEAISWLPSQGPELSLASSRSMRWTRSTVINALLKAFAGYPDKKLVTATVIKSTWILSPGELLRTDAKKVAHQFRVDLNAVGLTSMQGPFIAFMHGEFDPVSRRFALHWHVLTTRAKGERLKALRNNRRYTKTPSGAAPIVVKPVFDRLRQVSYLVKSFWPSRGIREVDGEIRRDRQPQRIGEPFHTAYLVWLDRHRLLDLVVLNDCWSRRRGGSAAMRDLVRAIEAS